ncbi:MAG: signal peptidase I [Devosia sp.]|nr:signal peptidase I [Devosia sp.]
MVAVWQFLLALIGLTHSYYATTASMQPTLRKGDVFAIPVVRFYGVGPPTGLGHPGAGDFVLFFNRPTGELYYKRVVALAGDTVQMKRGRLFINSVVVEREAEGQFTDTDSLGVTVSVTRYVETLPNGARHEINEISDDGPLDNTGLYVVPEGTVFALGDNRDRSADSRVLPQVGYIDVGNIVGISRAREKLFFWSRGSD